MTIKVLLAEDQGLVRAGIRGLLENGQGITVVGEARNGVEAVCSARRYQPDVVLMDIRMPLMDGLEATRQIIADEKLGACRVVVLTTFDLDDYVFEALRAGASGFLSKDIEPDELRRAVRVIAAGEALLSPRVTRRLIAHFVKTGGPRSAHIERLSVLTDREREVMSFVAAGLSNTAIGRELSISVETARTHVHRAMNKLGARDRAEMVVVAYETGLVHPGHT